FPSEVEVSGLRCGMSIGDARETEPSLTIRPGSHPAPTSGLAQLNERLHLRLQFLFDELRVIEFLDDRAVYPDELPTPFPAPVDPPGAPFKDPTFKLVVMSELLDRHIIDLGKPGELAQFVLKRAFDVENEGYSLLRPLYDYLVRFPLSKAHLDAVETIIFDGGNSIYSYI